MPFLQPNSKAWLLAAAGNKTGVLGRLLDTAPELAGLADPYTGYTALHWAAKVGPALSTLPAKLTAAAAQHDNAGLVTRLAAGGRADINSQTHGGYTALHLAAITGSNKVTSCRWQLILNNFSKYLFWFVNILFGLV